MTVYILFNCNSCVIPHSSQIIFFPPVINRIVFFTAGKNRNSFVTRF